MNINDSQLICSVIVPVYNVGKYLRRCLNSLKNQSGNDFEVIMVDDGSSDNSLAICNEYAEADSRFKVIHKENGGVSSARNIGLDQATGKYIAFVDSDDYVTKDYFEVLRPLMLQKHEFIVYNNYQELGDGKVETYDRGLEERVYSIEELKDIQKLTPYYKDFFGLLGTCPWNKIYSRIIVEENEIRFNTEMTFGEDGCFVFDFLTHINRLYLSNRPLYYYSISNNDSAMRCVDIKKIGKQMYDMVTLLNRRRQYVKAIHFDRDFANNDIDGILFMLNRLVRVKANRDQLFNILKNSGAQDLLIRTKPKGIYRKAIKWFIVHKQYNASRYMSVLYGRMFRFKGNHSNGRIILNLQEI